MTLASLTLAVMLALPHPPPEAHARALSDAIAEAAHQAPLWATGDGGEDHGSIPAGEAATAAVLLAIARHESGFLVSVARCVVTGDKGRSIGSFQVQRHAWGGHSRDDVCESDALQATLSLDVMRAQQKRAPRAGLWKWLAGYASGDMGVVTRASRELTDGAWVWCKRLGLVCDTGGMAAPRWKAPS